MTSESPGDAAATFCATFFDELATSGVRLVVLAPGSRSTPLALAAAGEQRLRVEVHHDERSAGFMALGAGKATGVPAVVVTTSGTAAAELHAAVVEAHQAMVPMIVATADRPPGYADVGAPQTIDQRHIFGSAVRWYGEPGLPNRRAARSWRSIASRAHAGAAGSPPGPVHLNLAFDEPLLGVASTLPQARPGRRPWFSSPRPQRMPDELTTEALGAVVSQQRGVIVAGGDIQDSSGVHQLAERLRWPLLADPRSGTRTPAVATISHADALLRHEGFAARARPDVVVRLGSPPASKVVTNWLDSLDAWQVAVENHGKIYDPGHSLDSLVEAEPGATCRVLAELPDVAPVSTEWLDLWAGADAVAAEAIDRCLAGRPWPNEPALARTVASSAPDNGYLMVSSSMPIRDLEWYSAPRQGPAVMANRGANGIDGVVSTALGVAIATAEPVVALVGDVAMLHDSNALVGSARRDGVSLTVVVADNNGGGIFSFLPQAAALGAERFEKLFGTPHGTDLCALAAAHGAWCTDVKAPGELAELLARAPKGVRVLRVRTDRQDNVAVHADLHRGVTAALERARYV